MQRSTLRAGFVLTELLAAAVVLAAVAAILIALAAESRRQSTLGDDLANFKQFAFGTGAYAADHDDRVWGFSWPGGHAAHTNQAVEIIRRRTGRTDILPPTNWLPDVHFAPLVLADYLDDHLPARFLVSPADRLRLLWQSDPEEGYFALGPAERPSHPSNPPSIRHWPYSSSYMLTPTFWSRDAGNTVHQQMGGAHNSYLVPFDSLVTRRLSEVAFPAQKAMVHDEFQRHFGPRVAYFGYAEARVPVLRVDGSIAVTRTADSNLGFHPPTPLNQVAFTQVQYSPDHWQPPALNGQATQLLQTRYRFTRSGLRGRDFGGPEVPWTE